MSVGNTARDYSDDLDKARSLGNEQLSNQNQLQSPGQFNVPKNGAADNHVDRLAEAREGDEKKNSGSGYGKIKDAVKMAKNLTEVATPMGAVSLLKQVNLIGDMPYVAAMGSALLKDLLDFVAAPTVILSILFSALCSIFIFMMMLLVGAGGKKKGASKIITKVLLLMGGGVADSIPGIDFLPIESITVAAIYFLELVERKNAPKE